MKTTKFCDAIKRSNFVIIRICNLEWITDILSFLWIVIHGICPCLLTWPNVRICLNLDQLLIESVISGWWLCIRRISSCLLVCFLAINDSKWFSLKECFGIFDHQRLHTWLLLVSTRGSSRRLELNPFVKPNPVSGSNVRTEIKLKRFILFKREIKRSLHSLSAFYKSFKIKISENIWKEKKKDFQLFLFPSPWKIEIFLLKVFYFCVFP